MLPGAMRGLVAVALLLASVGLSGCFERSGTLTIELSVDQDGHVQDFRSLNVTLKDVRIKAKTLNPETFPSAVGRADIAAMAREGERKELFAQQVRSDNYQRIEVTTQSSTTQGTLADGTTVGVVVPPFVVTTDFDVPRGGAAKYDLVITVNKVDTGQGAPSYTITPDAAASGVVAG
jgi:hypothetical protein